MGGPWDKPSTDSESDKTRWLSKGNPEKMPHISDFTYHKCTTLFLSLPMWLHVIIFPPTKHFVSLLSICLCKFIYTKSEVQGLVTGYWPLRPGAWDSELSMPQPDYNLCPGNQNPSSSCCRLSRLRSKGSLLHTMNNFTFCKTNNFKKSPLQSWWKWVLWL